MPRYLVSWGDPLQRLYDIQVIFVAPSDNPSLKLPVWRPGRYLVQNYAANVREFTATNAIDTPLRTWKDELSTWRMEAAAGQEIRVRYRFYAGRLDAGSSYLDETEAYFNGSNLFMMVDGLRREECRLTVAAPASWLVETQLERGEDGAGAFVARDYDHLIDSPVIAAEKLTRHSFVAAGARIHLVFARDHGIDTEQYVEPVRAIIAEQAKMFGGLPLAEYRFLTHIGDKWHGVEHEDSCSMVAERGAMLAARPGTEGYDHFLSIASHEFFHVWNIKRMLPSRFLPYDYFTPTPTKLLWFFEGGTSYYGALTLVRSGVWTEEKYLDHLATQIATLENSPGHHFLSVAQASFDGWLHDAAHMHDRTNAWYSFYNKGELVAMLLDLTIRERTAGEKSLDDVMRLLWNRFRKNGAGIGEDGLENAVAELCDVGDFFTRSVDGTDDLPYAELLGTVGVELIVTALHAGRPALGCGTRDGGGTLILDAIVDGGAAARAGFLNGDELIAVDGSRVRTAADVQRIMGTIAEESSVVAIASRGGEILTVTLQATRDPRVEVRLTHEAATPRFSEWLGRNA